MPMVAPRPGDIGCTQIRGTAGRLIRAGEWLNGDGYGDFEHCFVYLGGSELIEAEPGGARIAHLSEYDQRTIRWVRCPDPYRTQVAAAARALEGTPYSFLDYWAIAAHRLHIPVPGLRAYIGAEGHLICSQLADLAARRGGWILFNDNRWAGYVTPSEIAALGLAA